KQVRGQWKVHLVGGKVATDIDLFDWVKQAEQLGAGEVLFTSMDHDGTKNGFANGALRKLSDLVHVPIIASGGAGTMQHFADAFTLGNADAALAASVFHFKEIPIPALKHELQRQGIAMRI
ncbi:MAG: imidazole glycerol phosphate synthase subunit HisF, partial [Flavobacteriales bacterium]|nr:imidazole glycerol phosphate synthase subunit HisF [Flavobacteriales bacterium]